MEREEIISLLKSRFPDAEVFASVDADYVCVRSVIGQSNFGKNEKGEPVTVPITDTKRYHLDTIRFRLHNPIFDWNQWEWRDFRGSVKEQTCVVAGCEQGAYMGKMCHYHFFSGNDKNEKNEK